MGKKWEVKRWDICQHLHAMSDCGHDPTSFTGYSKHHTHDAECYASQKGIKCTRQGRCIKAYLRIR